MAGLNYNDLMLINNVAGAQQRQAANGVPLAGPLGQDVLAQPRAQLDTVPLAMPNTPPEIRHGQFAPGVYNAQRQMEKPLAQSGNTMTTSRPVAGNNGTMPNGQGGTPRKPVNNGGGTPAPAPAIPEVTYMPPKIVNAPVETNPLGDNGYDANHSAPPPRSQQTQQTTAQAPAKDRYQSIYGALFGNEPYEEGKKWISFMEHGMQSPVNDNTMLHQNVQNEIALAKLEQQKREAKQNQELMGRVYGSDNAEVRRRKTELFDQRKDLLKQWEDGKYVANEQAIQTFFNKLNNIDNILRDEYGADTRVLTPPSDSPGGFKTAFRKEIAEPTNTAIKLSTWMKQIYDKVQEDPSWLNSPDGTEAFDKLGEFAILQEAESKGAIADAEKVRIQVATMSEPEKKLYQGNMQLFLMCNNIAQALAQSNRLDHSTMASLQQWSNLMHGISDYDEDTSKGGRSQRQAREDYQKELINAIKDPRTAKKKGDAYIANTILGIYAALQRADGNIPVELQAAVSSMKNNMDGYIQYIMQSAPTNKQLIWDVASRVFNTANTKSKYWAKMGGQRYGMGIDGLWNPNNAEFSKWLRAWQDKYGQIDPVLLQSVASGGKMPHPVHIVNSAGDYGANNNGR